MTEEARKWMAAAGILATDSAATVVCPVCMNGTLLIRDELYDGPRPGVDRYLICKACGAWNVVHGYQPQAD